ncbi:MAG TPA: hypothetical protein VK595_03525 [Vicinamibacterales bacterium]|jgi:hypothetical protein|nr:hypothetical protein [Vicinamibacterales bacterium]
MIAPRYVPACALAGALVFLALPIQGWHQIESGAAKTGRQAAQRDVQHDFDFEFGSWKVHIRRLVKPLTGSNTWVDLEGTSIVRKVWDGRANQGELQVQNATTQLEGLSLRLYNPQSRQWNIYWATSKDGSLGTAMIGQFTNGRGEFFNQELFQGQAVYVRFIFSDITPVSFRLEQSFSADGGTTWEPNWIAMFTRPRP